MIYETYDEAVADDLIKRFVNSIKTQILKNLNEVLRS